MVSSVGWIAAFVLSSSRPDQFCGAKYKATTQHRRRYLHQSTTSSSIDPVPHRKLHVCRLSRLVLHDSHNGSQSEFDDKSNVNWLAERFGLNAKWKARSTAKRLNELKRGTLCDHIEWIQDHLSLTEKDVAKMIRIYPPILWLHPASNVQPSTEFLQRRLQLGDQELSRFIVRCPGILLSLIHI